jgi:hypothetical protein
MLLQALTIIRKELDTYLVSQDGDSVDERVLLENPSSINWNDPAANGGLTDKVIMSLAGIEEVTMRRNDPHYKIRDNQTEYTNPPVYLDLSVMFSSYFPEDYALGITRLTQVIEFFQGKSVFSLKANPLPEFFAVPDINDLKVQMDLKQMTLEQTSQLWLTLGGRMLPSVCYTARTVAVKRPATDEVRGIITEVQVKS